MQGHAAANTVPVCASNRVGTEVGETCSLTFYGNSFIADPKGEIIVQAGRDEETVLTATLEIDHKNSVVQNYLFRDRRPDLYENLMSLDGRLRPGNH
jgi:N-carbamoylputrescine amidase